MEQVEPNLQGESIRERRPANLAECEPIRRLDLLDDELDPSAPVRRPNAIEQSRQAHSGRNLHDGVRGGIQRLDVSGLSTDNTVPLVLGHSRILIAVPSQLLLHARPACQTFSHLAFIRTHT